MFYDLDTELSYQCDPGYKRKGFQVAQCFFYNGTARWFGPDLTCHPIDCGAPEEILNGKRTGDCTTYRCQVCHSISSHHTTSEVQKLAKQLVKPSLYLKLNALFPLSF